MKSGATKSHRRWPASLLLALLSSTAGSLAIGSRPAPAATAGVVVSQHGIASDIGARALQDGGNAVDAAIATAFALAVVHPAAGNIGGGGFLVYRPAVGEPVAYDFRERAPLRASATMFLRAGAYDAVLHHDSHVAVGVPGTVAGLHLAWKDHGRLPWKRLLQPAITLAREGFVVSDGLAASLSGVRPQMERYPASIAQFTKAGVAYAPGEVLKQADLARTLERIAARGPRGFYDGETALAIEREMRTNGGLITREDLRRYVAVRRTPLRGTYRGHDVIAMPLPTSGGVALIEMLNVLEGFDLKAMGALSPAAIHVMAESMRRAYADRARFLGDPDFTSDMPIARLISKEYARQLRGTIDVDRASTSSPTHFEWPRESDETTHISIVDRQRNAVAMTYTLEDSYGMKAVVPGAGFLLNNEMGDFNAAPGLTTEDGLIGTAANLAAPGKRMLSSMTPTILARDGRVFMVTGSPGGRTIINTVLHTIVNLVDFGMAAQQAVDAPRFHHQWLPDRIDVERNGLSPDAAADLRRRGHTLREVERQGAAQVIVYDASREVWEGATDRRVADGGVATAR